MCLSFVRHIAVCLLFVRHIAYHQIAKRQAGKYFALFYDANTNTNSESGLVADLFKVCGCKDITDEVAAGDTCFIPADISAN